MPKTEAIYIEKLRNSGLRPTKQRIKICEILFNREKTFHFSINELMKIIQTKINQKISLATVYNTVHTFKKKGHLKEINIGNDMSYFDTNTNTHHHFYHLGTRVLTDIPIDRIRMSKSPELPAGTVLDSVEVTVRIVDKVG